MTLEIFFVYFIKGFKNIFISENYSFLLIIWCSGLYMVKALISWRQNQILTSCKIKALFLSHTIDVEELVNRHHPHPSVTSASSWSRSASGWGRARNTAWRWRTAAGWSPRSANTRTQTLTPNRADLFRGQPCTFQRQTPQPTLLARRIWNMSGRPCVISSSVYSSSWMQLKSLSRPWMSGRRFWMKQVRRDSSQVCSVQGTPGNRTTWRVNTHVGVRFPATEATMGR